MDLRVFLREKIDKAVGEFGVGRVQYKIEYNKNLDFGDLTSNIALILQDQLKEKFKSAQGVAEQIVAELEKDSSISDVFSKIKIDGPGFINFWLKQEYLVGFLKDLVKTGKVFPTIQTTGRLEMFENTQPNTNKPLHIGHLRNTALGVAIVNLRRAIGANALSVNINNDRGIHIVKAMWGYLAYGRDFKSSESSLKLPGENWRNLLEEWSKDPNQWGDPQQESIKPDHFVGKFYVLADKAEKEFAEKATSQMQEMLVAWEEAEEKIRSLWKILNDWFYQGFGQTHARFLAIKPEDKQFDKEWFESEIYSAGKKIVLDNLGRGLFYKREDGAILADLKEHKLPDKIVIRSDGTAVYITQDLELARLRLQEDKADLVAYIVGNEQDLHFRQLFSICEKLGFGKREKFLHISYGTVNLKGGVKMSSREGTVITADELMDKMRQEIKKKFQTKDNKLIEEIAIGAIKYAMLKVGPKQNIDFDMEESISLSGDSGPYLQYVFARTQSVLAKRKTCLPVERRQRLCRRHAGRSKNEKRKTEFNFNGWGLSGEEGGVLRLITRFQDVVLEAAGGFSPNVLCRFLFDLGQSFNLFYEKHKILESQNQDFRLALTDAVGKILSHGLSLLSISAPNKI